MKKKVYVGVSGGVDSAVVAHLLKAAGYDVTGVFMKNWSGEDFGLQDQCPWREDLDSSMEVCEFLKIPHMTLNFEREYREFVVEDFFEQYRIGNTPNPDILCNKFIKFDLFLKRCLAEGADMIATGHYAKVRDGKLYRAKDSTKDQTYFLSGVTREQLDRTLFPLGDMLKTEVRELASQIGLPNAQRKDSQGICFIGEIDLREFLQERLKPRSGEIVDIETDKVVGEHNGVWFYTEGQRKGLDIGGLSEPYFIVSKDASKNHLYVAKGRENPLLWRDEVLGMEVEMIDGGEDIAAMRDLRGLIRHRGKLSPITITPRDDGVIIKFADKQWAPSPGQSVVIYEGERCIGRSVMV